MPMQYVREELYEKVWTQPLVKVAQEYGVSAVALGKACRKLSVPLPGRGYWARLVHGRVSSKRPPLPKLQKVPVVVRSLRAHQAQATSGDQSDPEFAAIDSLLSSGALVPPSILPSDVPHDLMRRTLSAYQNRKRTDEKGVLLPRKGAALDVLVTPAIANRAFAVMALILASLQRQSIPVRISKDGGTYAEVAGRQIYFGIEERIRQHVTKRARVPQPKFSWDYDRSVTYEPTGSLVLIIHVDLWTASAVRKRWSDGKKQRVESLVPDFVAGMLRTAITLRREAEQRQQRELERRKREEELLALRDEIEAEEKKLKQFDDWVEEWNRAERLRRFIAVYAERSQAWPAEKQPKYKAWIEWARRQADRIDPFTENKPESILDRKHELHRF